MRKVGTQTVDFLRHSIAENFEAHTDVTTYLVHLACCQLKRLRLDEVLDQLVVRVAILFEMLFVQIHKDDLQILTSIWLKEKFHFICA